MVNVALWVKLEARADKADEVEAFLKEGLALVSKEPKTIVWFAIRLGTTTFGIFDAFSDESGREGHLAGEVAKALMSKAPDLLASPPVIERIDVIAAKLPK